MIRRSRGLLVLLFLALPAAAGYGERLEEAVREQFRRAPGDPPDASFHRAYARLYEVAQLDPARPEAFLFRGVNRCEVARLCDGVLESTLNDLRARGAPADEIRAKEEGGALYIRERIAEGIRDFQIAERNMHAIGQVDRNAIAFASACIKFARREFLEAVDGAPGAIEDLKGLHARGWEPRHCGDLIAKCYMDLGARAFGESDYAAAQAHWDDGLKWAASPDSRRILLTNKAGAFEMDNEFGLAEKVLREQIAQEPHRPGHWKNLGLVLGFENRLRGALHAYTEARRLCMEQGGTLSLGILHGNAWLKAAMIHGKLLEEDGDLLLAWRLFLEYRGLHRDDYNFCLNFGDFAFHMGAYDLAWTYLSRARDLQPFCPNAYQILLQVAPRTAGTPEEIRARIGRAQEELQMARESYLPRLEAPALKRLCGGLRDLGDESAPVLPATLLDPDPLAAWGPKELPSWIRSAAASRKPFRPYDPEIDDTDSTPLPVASVPPPLPPLQRPLLPRLLGGLLLLVAVLGALLLLRARRAPAA